MLLGPAAQQVLGGLLRAADAAADGQHGVVARADVGVGGGQEVVELLPRVVAAGAAALDLDDDRHVGQLGVGGQGVGDGQDGLDLLDGARLEGHVRDAAGAQLAHQRHGLVDLGDARGDGDAVDRAARGHGALHQAARTDVHAPQVRVQEHGVELRGGAFVEELVQAGDVVVEDLRGDLAAAGQLGPEAGVGRRGDDGRVDGGRGHAAEQDRRTAGGLGELGLDAGAAVAGDQARHVDRPGLRGGGGAAGLEQLGLALVQRHGDHADAGAGGQRAGQRGDALAGAHLQDPLGAGVDDGGDVGGPIDGGGEHVLGDRAGEGLVDADGGGQLQGLVDGGGHVRVVEAGADGQRRAGRGESGPAAQLRGQLGGVLLGGAAEVLLGGAQVGGGADDDAHRAAVAQAHDGVAGQVRGDQLGADPGNDHHGVLGAGGGGARSGAVALAGGHAGDAAAAGHGDADDLGQRHDVAGAIRLLGGGDAEDALGVADGGDGLGRVDALGGQQVEHGDLRDEDARHGNGRSVEVGQAGDGGGGRRGLLLGLLVAVERVGVGGGVGGGGLGGAGLLGPLEGGEAVGALAREAVGDGRQALLGLGDELADAAVDAGGDAGGEGLEPGVALPGEAEGELLALVEPLG